MWRARGRKRSMIASRSTILVALEQRPVALRAAARR
jgi:hypothetical protein